jgi:hypothetical protein
MAKMQSIQRHKAMDFKSILVGILTLIAVGVSPLAGAFSVTIHNECLGPFGIWVALKPVPHGGNLCTEHIGKGSSYIYRDVQIQDCLKHHGEHFTVTGGVGGVSCVYSRHDTKAHVATFHGGFADCYQTTQC